MKKTKIRLVSILLILTMVFIPGCSSKKNIDEETKILQNIIDDNYRTYYEIFLYSYYDSNNDGIGDIQGLIDKLDYLNDGNDKTTDDLGINGIWLMPIMQSTTYHKYDVVDYYNIDTDYGTMDDFDELISECNDRGIKVIIDLPLNHTSSKNEWFVEACNYIESLPEGQEPSVDECKYFGYYNFAKDKNADGTYYQVGDTNWYYEGKFWSEMPDLNLYNENVRKDLEDVASFWLDKGIGGFRLDAAKEYVSNNAEKNVEILTWFSDYVKGIDPDCYLVAEVWENYYTYKKYYASGIDSVFNFEFAQQTGNYFNALNPNNNYTAADLAQSIVTIQDDFSSLNADYIDAPFICNHDTGRSAGYFPGDDSTPKVKMIGGMNLMMGGSPFIYYGEEIGMKGSGRDENKRAPMYWSKKDSAEGMTDGPSAMESFDQKYGSVEEQLKDNDSILSYYSKAILLRNQNPEIARGVSTVIPEVNDTDICALQKEYDGSKIVILMNCSSDTKTVTISKSQYGYSEIRGSLVSTYGDEIKLDGEKVTLPPYSIVILK